MKAKISLTLLLSGLALGLLSACGGGGGTTPDTSGVSTAGNCAYSSNWDNVKIGAHENVIRAWLGTPDSPSGNTLGYKGCKIYDIAVFNTPSGGGAPVRVSAYRRCSGGTVVTKDGVVASVTAPELGTLATGELVEKTYSPEEVLAIRAQCP